MSDSKVTIKVKDRICLQEFFWQSDKYFWQADRMQVPRRKTAFSNLPWFGTVSGRR
jgi:hypothetical protein